MCSYLKAIMCSYMSGLGAAAVRSAYDGFAFAAWLCKRLYSSRIARACCERNDFRDAAAIRALSP